MNALSGPCLWFCKAAVLVLYIRLFGTVKWLRRIAQLTLSLSFLVYFSSIPIATVFCAPVKSGQNWLDPKLLQSCGKTTWQAPLQGSLNVAVDMIILVLPLPVIRRLKLRASKRIALAIVFLMGFL